MVLPLHPPIPPIHLCVPNALNATAVMVKVAASLHPHVLPVQTLVPDALNAAVQEVKVKVSFCIHSRSLPGEMRVSDALNTACMCGGEGVVSKEKFSARDTHHFRARMSTDDNRSPRAYASIQSRSTTHRLSPNGASYPEPGADAPGGLPRTML